MKKIKSVVILVFLCITLFCRCEYEYDDHELPQIYIPQSGLSLHEFGVADTTYSLSVYLSGVRKNEDDIKVSLSLDEAKIQEYNVENDTNYELLPANAYQIIEKGVAVSGYVFDLAEAENNAKEHNSNPSVPLLYYIDPSTTTINGSSYDVLIPNNQSRGNITFTVSGSELEIGKEYVLPLTIGSVSKYEILEEKSFALFRIMIVE